MNLGLFANAVATEAGMPWSIEPNDEGGGGRIILLKQPITKHPDLLSSLAEQGEKNGNRAIDFLFCVPPNNVITTNNSRSSKLGKELELMGHAVWDGTSEKIRRDFPRGLDTYRIVQYASCRGLEGWTVILESMDAFWEERFYHAQIEWNEKGSGDLFKSEKDFAKEAAWYWCLIPLTRPIDTLVITLENTSSEFSKILLTVAKNNPDFVEVID